MIVSKTLRGQGLVSCVVVAQLVALEHVDSFFVSLNSICHESQFGPKVCSMVQWTEEIRGRDD